MYIYRCTNRKKVVVIHSNAAPLTRLEYDTFSVIQLLQQSFDEHTDSTTFV